MSIEGQNWEPLPYLPLPGQCESLNCCAGVLTSWLSNTESFWVLIQVPEEQKWKKKHESTNTMAKNTEIKKWMKDVPQNTLNYQRFQRFTIVSTSQKQLQSIRKCKVVTGKSTKEKFTNLLWGTVSIFLYLQWTVYTFWSSFSY